MRSDSPWGRIAGLVLFLVVLALARPQFPTLADSAAFTVNALPSPAGANS